MGNRMELNRLRGELSMGGETLRDEQYEPMLGIIAAEQSRMNREIQDALATEPVENPDHYASIRTGIMVAANKRIVESARSILTPAQLATIETVYRRQRLQMESMDRMTKAQFEAEQQGRENGAN
jgi:hypothetical protein